MIHPPRHLLLFGVIGTIIGLHPKSKLQSSSHLARFLAHTNHCDLLVFLTDTNSNTTVCHIDFRSLQQALHPTRSLAPEFRSHEHRAPPQTITATTGPTENTCQAQKFPDAHLWEIAHNDEIMQLNEQNAINWLKGNTHRRSVNQ